MRTFFKLFGVTIAVILLQAGLLATGAYLSMPWLDIPMHFLGGVAMAVLALEAWTLLVPSAANSSIPLVVKCVAILGFVAIISIAWEWMEFAFDHVILDIRNLIGISQPSIGDTMADFFFDLLGGFIIFMLFWIFDLSSKARSQSFNVRQ